MYFTTNKENPMKALSLIVIMSFATHAWAVDTATMQKSAEGMHAQTETIKKDVMAKCVQVKKSEATCTELMKSCPDVSKLQACMDQKMKTATH
jgi:hypothetical protein